MIDRLIGTTQDYIVSGTCGKEYQDELKKLKKQLKAEDRKVEAIVVVRAIVITKKED